jgi:hypothetical protein
MVLRLGHKPRPFRQLIGKPKSILLKETSSNATMSNVKIRLSIKNIHLICNADIAKNSCSLFLSLDWLAHVGGPTIRENLRVHELSHKYSKLFLHSKNHKRTLITMQAGFSCLKLFEQIAFVHFDQFSECV